MIKQRTLWALALMLFASLVTFSARGTESTTARLLDGKVEGVIVESGSAKPIGYATVSIHRLADSTYVNGAVSLENGLFKIEDLPKGEYYAQVSFLGYKSLNTVPFTLDSSRAEFSMGNIEMILDAVNVGEVIVTSSQPKVDYRVDKKVVSVAQMLTSASMSAVEVLENVPSIKTDMDGNVTLRGSSDFMVLIDGKPTVLDPSDALAQIPASSIQNIEIITNPSVKYEPDGTGGIINIILKKNSMLGLQANFNVKYGSLNSYGADAALNYNFEKVRLFARVEVGDNPFEGEMSNYRLVEADGTKNEQVSEGKNTRTRRRQDYRFGVNWDITESDLFSFEANIGSGKMFGDRVQDYKTTIDDGSPVSELSYADWGRGSDYFALSSSYERHFGSKEHKLVVQGYMSMRDFSEYTTTTLSTLDGTINSGHKVNEAATMERYDLKADYSLPIGKSKFEAGVQYRLATFPSNITQQPYDNSMGEFVPAPELSSSLDFSSEVLSLYSTFNGNHDKFGYLVGLRLEHDNREIKSADNFTFNSWELFPSAHLSYSLNDNNQIMASYARRINRPRGHYLDPFLTWTDMFNVRSGNPELLPEYIDAMELAYVKQMGKTQLSVEGYYRIRQNKIEGFRTPYESSDATIDSEGVILTTFRNAGKDFSLGVEAMLTTPLTKWWEASFSGNIYDYRLEVEAGEESYNRESLTWDLRASTTFTLTKWLRLQLDGNYRSESITSQGSWGAYYSFNAGLKGDFLNRRLSASLTWRDFLSTAKYSSVLSSDGIYQTTEYRPHTPFIMLSIGYRLNNFKSSRQHQNVDDSEGGGDAGGGDFM